MPSPSRIGDRNTLQVVAGVVGAVFLIVGVLGFIPGIVTHYHDLSFMGHGSHAKLLDLFEVSVVHNAVHLLFGIAGIVMARSHDASRHFLVGGGAIYLVLWAYGLMIDKTSSVNFVPVNTADNWLHFALGAGMVALGLALARQPATRPATGSRAMRAGS